MDDKELLGLAAKAAGMDCRMRYCDAWKGMALYTLQQGYFGPTWNPLTDDGDALRLAVNLGLVIEIGYAARGFLAVRTNTDNWQEFREAWGSDPYAATRRAIVRAAAELGRDMT